MTILQVNYFLAASRAGSLTQAAEDLGVSQPTLSEQIRKLEQSVGVALFTRAKQGLTLTEAGHKFLPHAKKVARDYQAALDSVTGIRDRQEGTVTFGMFNSGQYVLSGLIPAFRAMYPNINIRVIGSNSAQVVELVRSGRLEAGVVALPIDARGLTISDVLWSCEAAYFHTKPALEGPVTIDGLLQRPLVLPDSGWAENDPTRRQLSERAQTLGIAFNPDIEVETGSAALAVAAAGTAAAVASVPVAQALGYTEKLNWVSLEPPLIETFAIITRDPTSLSPGTQALIKLTEEHMRMLHKEYLPA
ncbi:LysR family transcriptional regulator [Paenarthrobacter sp. NCHU4564]|uniref:LysR family transcriptional regulator n=1 Tax=Paenarthrobacter sp. NCHU4564 TaxID=3451353 RepID=UPI003F9736FA